MMSTERLDIFHCLKCGRTAYRPHAAEPPRCCGRAMACAAANVAEKHARLAARAGTAALVARSTVGENEHAVLEEVGELSRWCHAAVDENGSTYPEFAHRLESLRDLMLDRFEAAESESDLAEISTAEPRLIPDIARLRQQHRDLLECLDHLIYDLLQGEANFRGWFEVCDRFDSFESDCRRHEQAENDLMRAAVEEDLGTVD